MIHSASSNCRLILKFWDKQTDGRTDTTGRDCGRPHGSKQVWRILNDPPGSHYFHAWCYFVFPALTLAL